MSTTIEVFPGALPVPTFGAVTARATKLFREYFKTRGYVSDALFRVELLALEDDDRRSPSDTEAATWSDDYYAWFSIPGVKGGSDGYLRPTDDDVREDVLDMQRIYLPQDELRRFGIPEPALADGEIVPGWYDLVDHQVARAREYFATGYEVLRYIPRSPAAFVQTMAGIYEELLKKIERDPGLPLRARAALSKTEKLRVVVRSWLSSA